MFNSDNKAVWSLHPGSRISIIGGGPGGCFFAMHAIRLAEQKNLDVKISIFDNKDFLLSGHPGCNLCAGVISENLVNLLKENSINLESPKIQRKIKGYVLQTPFLKVQLPHPDRLGSIYSVYRGNGPCFSDSYKNYSFDDALLQNVIRRGVQHIPEKVIDIKLSENPAEPVKFFTQVKSETKEYTADLIVGAFGINSQLLQKISHLGFAYRPPETVATFQAEYPMPHAWISERFRDNIIVFSYRSRRIRYVIAVPKKDFVSISIINRGDANFDDFKRFINSKMFKDYLPKGKNSVTDFCFCKPQIAISSAKNPFTNRFVLIGDASYTRIYKNGIESAFYTALYAAQTALNYGVNKKNFKKHYSRPLKKMIVRDNIFGRVMFFIYDNIVKNNFFSLVFLHAITSSPKSRKSRDLRFLVWYMFTGHKPYIKIFSQFINPFFQLFMAKSTFEIFLKKIFSSGFFPAPEPKNNLYIKADKTSEGLKDGTVVGIVGGGPGGIACAITLKALARETGIKIHTVIYEGKTYSGVPHFNQCVGVLSPPIRSLLEDQLKIKFPEHLVQRKITGYILHSDQNRLSLQDESDCSFSVRRITFDNYLMEQAVEQGVEIRQSRVTDIELHPDQVIIYSETDFLRADVVVGAFGLDDASIKMFERVTDYRAPDFLYSIVTKIHPGDKYMKVIGDSIFAFLPSFHQIEFGAITPKQNHITINIAGKDVDALWMDTFLNYPPVQRILPGDGEFDKKELHYFKGKFPISIAKNFYGHRYVLVGDAAGLVRPFKGKGINSAIQSGIDAALVMMNEGITKTAFIRYKETCGEIIDDMFYGHFMRRFAILSSNYGFLDFLIFFAKQNGLMKQALFNSVSAHKLYREIFYETMNRPFLRDAFFSFLKYKFKSPDLNKQ